MRGLCWASLGMMAGMAAMPMTAMAQDSTPACTITTRATPMVNKVISAAQFNFAGYQQLCEDLRNARMGVAFVEGAGVVAERGYGVVIARAYDLTTQTEGNINAVISSMDPSADGDGRDRALMVSINQAMASIAQRPRDYIASVHQEQARLRALFAAAPPATSTPTSSPASAASEATADPADCRISYRGDTELDAFIKKWGNLPGDQLDQLCQQLADADAGVSIVHALGAVSGQSYGWVAITLYDRATGIDGDEWGVTIATDHDVSEQNSEDSLWQAMHDGLGSMKLNAPEILGTVARQVARNRQIYAR